MEENDLQKTA